jgi:hypothetical protein
MQELLNAFRSHASELEVEKLMAVQRESWKADFLGPKRSTFHLVWKISSIADFSSLVDCPLDLTASRITQSVALTVHCEIRSFRAR